MRGFFSLLWFLLFSFSSYTRGTKQYNRETYIIDEPQGFFSKLDSDSLTEKSIWNHKFTYLSKRNLIPTSDEFVNDGSDAGDLEKRSSIPLPDAYQGEYYVDANVNLLKRGEVPEEYVVKDGQNDVTTVIDIKHSDIAKVEAANMQAVNSADDNTQNAGDSSQDRNIIQDASPQDPTLKDALVAEDKPKSQDAPDNKSEASAESTESTESGSGDVNTKREAVTPTSVDVEQGADSGSGAIEENTSAVSGAQPQVYASGSAWITHDTDESGSSAETASLVQPKVVAERIMVDDTETVNINKLISSSESSVVKKNSIPVEVPNKRQYISRPKFVVRNGYVYMKAPPLTQKTIVTTHIPRPPMVMPYDRFIHSYRRGGDRGYGFGRRSRYMVTPSQRYSMEGAEDNNYDDDRAEDTSLGKTVFDDAPPWIQ